MNKNMLVFWNHFSQKCPLFATKIMYRYLLGKKLNLKSPKSFNEKQQWLKFNLYNNNQLVKKCIDKYDVRQYLEECGCASIANEIIGVWDDPDSINWSELPNQFVIKCTHGSGFNILCRDKNSFDIEDAKRKLKKWCSTDYGVYSVELIYYGIKPKIVCEQLINTDDDKEPTDYKFFCSYGEVKFIYVMLGHDEVQDYYTPDWKWIPVRSAGRPNAKNHMSKPKDLEKMIEYASVLSKPFPEVRVDFYYENNNIIFGELTFLTTGGFVKFDPNYYDNVFGDLFPEMGENVKPVVDIRY